VDTFQANDVAVVGSPSSNAVLTLDVLLDASSERLVGALLALETRQDGRALSVVGQVTSLALSNKWHEDSVFRNLIKRTGDIPPVTNRQDTRTAEFIVSATFEQLGTGWQPGMLGMVPPTGTRARRVTQKLLDELLALHKDELFYLGDAYGNDVMYPMFVKHFSDPPRGAGEAFHIGIFGKTGSGKSGLAKMLLLGYARHPELGILVIDPQGEFTLEARGTTVGSQKLPVEPSLKAMSRTVNIYTISQLQLTTWELFEEILLHFRFFRLLGIPAASIEQTQGAASVVRFALETVKLKVDELNNEAAFMRALNALTDPQLVQRVYSSQPRAQQLIAFVQALIADADRMKPVRETWARMTELFARGDGKRQIFGVVQDLIGQGTADKEGEQKGPRPIVVIDISETGNKGIWFEELERKIIIDLLQALIVTSSRGLRTSDLANVLVVLDEAARHAPSARTLEGYREQLRTLLRRATRETRKYGIGWMFVSQTLGGLDDEIMKELRINFFGYGLALGDEFRKLNEFAGGDPRAMELYQTFRDPAAFPVKELREFPFMVVGPASPLSFSGKPIFFTAFTDPDRFLTANSFNIRSGAPVPRATRPSPARTPAPAR
jgi:DNA helicase HerA-like ATPase